MEEFIASTSNVFIVEDDRKFSGIKAFSSALFVIHFFSSNPRCLRHCTSSVKIFFALAVLLND